MIDKEYDDLVDIVHDGNGKLKKIDDELKKEKEEQTEEDKKIDRIERDLLELNPNYKTANERTLNIGVNQNFSNQDKFFLENNPLLLDTLLEKEIYKNPKLLPELSKLDYEIIGIAGTIAVVIDFLIVKIPKDVIYLNKFHQEGSSITKWLKSLGVDDKRELRGFFKWFESHAKVPYDLTHNANIEGFNPRTHRLLSLAHDPFFGLIFGIIDIIFGQMTTIDTSGKLIIVPTSSTSFGDKIFSPIIWLAHIVSDICTKQGIPVPGWGFTQIIQFGNIGEKDRTLADISRWMYLNGYDLRHFITMSVPVAVIEIIIRAYHYLSSVHQADIDGYLKPQYIKELNRIDNNLKLHKMLFLSHTFAAGGNVAKVIAYQGNPLALNVAQWMRWIDESINIISAVLRDKTPEKMIRNRAKIEDEWGEIKSIPINQLKLLNLDTEAYLQMDK